MPSDSFGLSRQLSEAIALHKQGQLAHAKSLYEAILLADPTDFDALLHLGILRLQQDEAAEAVRLISLAVEERPDSSEAHFNLASALQGSGQFDRAAASYRAALAIKPSFEVCYGLATTLHAMRRPDEAITCLEQAISMAPENADTNYGLATALQSLGRVVDAIQHYEKALAQDPDFAEARYGLAAALSTLERYTDAIPHLERAIDIDNTYAEAHHALGDAYRKLGNFERADQSFRHALAADPNLRAAAFGLVIVLIARGQIDEALDRVKRIAETCRDETNALAAIGRIYRLLQRDREAISWFRKSLATRPNDVSVLKELGGAFEALLELPEAVSSYERALQIDPNDAPSHNALGRALQLMRRYDEAQIHFDKALAVDPKFADAHANRGMNYAILGRLEDARSCFETAIGLDPRRPDYLRVLANSKKIEENDPIFSQLQELLRAKSSLAIRDQIELHFAMGKALSDIDQPDQSFQHLLDGNALKRRVVPYDESYVFRMFDRTKSVFTRELVRQLAEKGDQSDAPVFIVGMPRSGTTLMEQILAGHPEVFAAGERTDFREAADRLGAALPSRVDYPDYVPVLPLAPSRLQGLARAYLDAVVRSAPEARKRVIDKMPGNFVYTGLIHVALPRARIIHVCRDPIDTCLSCFGTLFDRGNYFSYDLGELGRYYRLYQDMMTHWRSVLPEGAMLDVRYEDLVDNLETEARRIVTFCGLDWDPACLAFHKAGRPVQTASFAQVRQPIYRTSIGRKHPEQALLRPLLEGLAVGSAAPR